MKILICLIIFISIFTILCSENREIIRVKIILGARTYYRYVQLSNFNFPNSFTIIQRDENWYDKIKN